MPFKRAHAMVRTVHTIIGMTCTVRPITPSFFFVYNFVFIIIYFVFIFFSITSSYLC